MKRAEYGNDEQQNSYAVNWRDMRVRSHMTILPESELLSPRAKSTSTLNLRCRLHRIRRVGFHDQQNRSQDAADGPVTRSTCELDGNPGEL